MYQNPSNDQQNLEQMKAALLQKGDSDFISAAMKLVYVQSNTFLYAVNKNTSEISRNTDEFTQEIGNITSALSMINQISSKTKILSINASIEAARAGEAGKGFAVVAKEVGNLSVQTIGFTNEVGEVNNSLLKNADANKTTLARLMDCSSRFGSSSETVMGTVARLATIEENGFIMTTLAKRLENHADFMQNICHNAGQLDKVADHHTCAFGKWYDHNRTNYQNIEGYADIERTHEAFHRAAIKFNETTDVNALVDLLEHSNDILLKFFRLASNFKKEIQSNNKFFEQMLNNG
ncbi:MAG: methyl-accepting chemotaxis protein [Lachnospiraceae bacterium]|jgi:methyl-accepting chemotaxis protein|nr:methyl-accepting chemotaxis protein [Lachnospiraceae bacterium]